jgi:hypothetical protein
VHDHEGEPRERHRVVAVQVPVEGSLAMEAVMAASAVVGSGARVTAVPHHPRAEAPTAIEVETPALVKRSESVSMFAAPAVVVVIRQRGTGCQEQSRAEK